MRVTGQLTDGSHGSQNVTNCQLWTRKCHFLRVQQALFHVSYDLYTISKVYNLIDSQHFDTRVRMEIRLVFQTFPGQNYFFFQTFQGILFIFM